MSIPKTLSEVLNYKEWKNSTSTEIQALEKDQTWSTSLTKP